MQKIKELLQKKPILKTVLVFLVITLGFIFFNQTKEKKVTVPTQTSTSSEIATFEGISPGTAFNEDEINEKLGFPVSTKEEKDGVEVSDYRSTNEYRNNQLKIQNGTIKFIREVVNLDAKKSSEDIIKTFGISTYVLYNKDSSSVFDLYVYPNNGIAYLGHEDGTLLEIWYFQPTDINNFIETWATNYQEEKPTVTSQY